MSFDLKCSQQSACDWYQQETGKFLNAAEAELKKAGVYREPLPGDVRFGAILAGIRTLVDRAK